MTTGKPSLRSLGLIQLVSILVLAISVGVLAFLSVNQQIALCAFKTDLETRLAVNRELLEGTTDPIIRAYGLSVPRSVIESNVRSQQSTLDSLNNLYC